MRSLYLPLVLVLLGACRSAQPNGPDYGKELAVGASPLILLGPGDHFPDVANAWIDRVDLFPSLESSIGWTKLEYAQQFSQPPASRTSTPCSACNASTSCSPNPKPTRNSPQW